MLPRSLLKKRKSDLLLHFRLIAKFTNYSKKIYQGGDTKVPDGYTVEPIMTGLSFPTDLAFAPDGTLFVSEGGSSSAYRPYMPARIIRVKPSGEMDIFKWIYRQGTRYCL